MELREFIFTSHKENTTHKTRHTNVRFEAFTAVKFQVTLFWVVIPRET